LEHTDAYDPFKAADLCSEQGMYKEQAYLLIKVGNRAEARKVLIDLCENVSEVIEMAVKFNINDDQLWEEIILKSAGNTSKVSQLLEFVDSYDHPKKIIGAYSNEVLLKDVRDSLIMAFAKLRLYVCLLTAAVNISEKSKQECMDMYLFQNC